jgi:putative FmdB family regulatory protein
MPIYEYSCEACDAQFEVLVRGGEQPRCPKCDATRLARLPSVPAAPAGGRAGLPVSDAPWGGPCGGGGCGRPECD